jgi:hypothetical protein
VFSSGPPSISSCFKSQSTAQDVRVALVPSELSRNCVNLGYHWTHVAGTPKLDGSSNSAVPCMWEPNSTWVRSGTPLGQHHSILPCNVSTARRVRRDCRRCFHPWPIYDNLRYPHIPYIPCKGYFFGWLVHISQFAAKKLAMINTQPVPLGRPSIWCTLPVFFQPLAASWPSSDSCIPLSDPGTLVA